MNLFCSSECLDGLYFYPRFNKFKWKEKWIKSVNKEIDSCIIPEVSNYVDILYKPTLLFLQDKAARALRSELKLPGWVRAFTHNNVIYIFFDSNNKKWKTHLMHEIFHAGVNQVCGNKKIIPDWFNEAIAYYISQDHRIYRKMIKYVKAESSRIINLFNNDLFIDSDVLYKFQIIKSFGLFFMENYGAHAVRNLISLAAQTGDFKQALDKCNASLLNHWIQWLLMDSIPGKK